MAERILITGGAGFIGSHLADELLARGFEVRILDCLEAQVHGATLAASGGCPAYLTTEVELLVGDVCDPTAVERALDGVDAVYHLAAAVGVGQSMYQIAPYTRANNLGTAVLLQALIAHPVRRLVVASSMSIYGEGLYRNRAGEPVGGVTRSLEALKAGDWEVRDAEGSPLTPVPTPESHLSTGGLQSVYALSKFDQERLCLLTGRAYGIPAVALRFFNTYGPRQALSNPYTGVLAIFAARLLNGKPPLLNEDGEQLRDFVHVRDVAHACRLALEAPLFSAEGTPVEEPVFNIGSGEARSVSSVGYTLAQVLGSSIQPEITGNYRVGDIRHCVADIGRARRLLGYEPAIPFKAGVRDLANWLREHPSAADYTARARAELLTHGLAGLPAAGGGAGDPSDAVVATGAADRHMSPVGR